MARTFDLLWEFGERGVVDKADQAPDCLSTSPVAIIAVWRYRYPVTFSRSKQASFSQDPTDATRLRDQVLIITEDIQTLTVSGSKENHVNQLSATLLPGANYLTEVFPGDHVAAWIVNSIPLANDLVARIRDAKQCNKFNDGLKFLGRCAGGPRVILNQAPQGLRTSGYTLSAVGFSEFDASIYFEPYLASENNSGDDATEWLRKTGIFLDDLIVGGTSQETVISVNKAMPLFFSAFFGKGFPKNVSETDTPFGQDTTKGLDDANSFVIPDEVGSILGIAKGSKPTGQKGWSDICNLLYGVQKYQLSNSVESEPASETQYGQIFSPDGLPANNDTRLLQCEDMIGSFLPSPPQFNGQRTVWSLFEQFLNPGANEIYTTLRAGPSGAIMPTLVVRQYPFSSGILGDVYAPRPTPSDNTIDPPNTIDLTEKSNNPIDKPHEVLLTRFGDLPRWVVSPILIQRADLGRHDATRFNFIHIYPETGLGNQQLHEYIVRDPPISDNLDIMRSGFRPYRLTVNCSPKDAETRKAGQFMWLMSDFLMGQHLTLTGTIELVGIQSPICIGDNLEFDKTVFHIEGITHTYSFQPQSGIKTFRTTLSVTHGQKVQQMDGSDLGLYTGTAPTDLRTYAGTTSREYLLNEKEPSNPPSPDTSNPPPQQNNNPSDPNPFGSGGGVVV
jgi:hypothetical protein